MQHEHQLSRGLLSAYFIPTGAREQVGRIRVYHTSIKCMAIGCDMDWMGKFFVFALFRNSAKRTMICQLVSLPRFFFPK